jgi:hypothetical protein
LFAPKNVSPFYWPQRKIGRRCLFILLHTHSHKSGNICHPQQS